jgi:NAD(P)-dependent dehydrogenase (short-subunit alcohol dehydrogenase family)
LRKLDDRVAGVTCGASKKGLALCEALAAEGAFAIVANTNVAGAEQVAAAIRVCRR